MENVKTVRLERAALRRALTIVLADDWGRSRQARMAQLDGDDTRRTCLRCGGDMYREGDVWRCWNCDNIGSAE